MKNLLAQIAAAVIGGLILFFVQDQLLKPKGTSSLASIGKLFSSPSSSSVQPAPSASDPPSSPSVTPSNPSPQQATPQTTTTPQETIPGGGGSSVPLTKAAEKSDQENPQPFRVLDFTMKLSSPTVRLNSGINVNTTTIIECEPGTHMKMELDVACANSNNKIIFQKRFAGMNANSDGRREYYIQPPFHPPPGTEPGKYNIISSLYINGKWYGTKNDWLEITNNPITATTPQNSKIPALIVLSAIKKHKPAVSFSHLSHAQRNNCSACHHKEEHGAEEKCSSCHKEEREGGIYSLKESYHTQCRACHMKEKNGPTKCDGCHIK